MSKMEKATSLLRFTPRLLCSFAVVLAALSSAVAAGGQMLARPGWAGSGMSIEVWWNHAVVYQVDPHGFADANGDGTGDLRGVFSKLDYIHSIGADAIVLTHFAPVSGDPAARLQSIDPAIGTLDDFDDLVRETSRDSMRLLVELDPQQLSDPAALATVARFWLNHGVGGIALRSAQPIDPAQVQKLRAVVKGFAGQRMLIDEADSPTRSSGADLTLSPALATLTQFNAAAVRPALQHLLDATKIPTLAATDDVNLPRSATRLGDGTNNAAIAKVLATTLLGTRANVELTFGQEIGLADKTPLMPWGVVPDPSAKKKPVPPTGPEVAAEEADSDSLLNWYRRLIDLHHGNATLRSGTTDLLNHDADNALVWVSRRGTASFANPPLVVICNLSAKPLTLSLTDDMKNLHLRGNFLRTVLRSDQGMGGMELNAITLQPFGVYMGELLY